MTHGDKAKAKAAKSNQASVKKAGSQGGENGKSKAAGQTVKAAGQGSKAVQSGKAGEGVKAGAEKAAAAKKGGDPAKDSAGRAEPKTKGSPAPADTAGSFSNPAISAASAQALKRSQRPPQAHRLTAAYVPDRAGCVDRTMRSARVRGNQATRA